MWRKIGEIYDMIPAIVDSVYLQLRDGSGDGGLGMRLNYGSVSGMYIPRPFSPLVFDRLQCKRSKTRWW